MSIKTGYDNRVKVRAHSENRKAPGYNTWKRRNRLRLSGVGRPVRVIERKAKPINWSV